MGHVESSSEPFDFIFAASGRLRNLHERLTGPLKEYSDDREGKISVNADYRVNLDKNRIDQTAGVWILDGFENGADDAFPFMALRAERIITSIMSVGRSPVKESGNTTRRETIGRAAL